MATLFECACVAEDVYHDRPTTVRGYRPIHVPDQELYCAGAEFAGAAYVGAEGVGLVAIRGSRELEDWKGANLDILRSHLPVCQLGSALAFFASAHRALERAGCGRYIVLGHSLGGGLAAVIAGAVTWVPVRGVTFNAPGLAQLVASSEESGFHFGCPNAESVMNFRAHSDVISRWGRHIGKVYDVPGGGRHGIAAFIACLNDHPIGGWQV